MLKHNENLCPERKVFCPFEIDDAEFVSAPTKLKIKEFKEHLEICGSMRVTCSECGCKIKRRLVNHHNCVDTLRYELRTKQHNIFNMNCKIAKGADF